VRRWWTRERYDDEVNQTSLQSEFAAQVDAVIALQETPSMSAARRALAETAAALCSGAAGEPSARRIILEGPGMAARRHALELAAAITGVHVVGLPDPVPDAQFTAHGTVESVFVTAELVRLFQAQLDWSAHALGPQADDFLNAILTSWMQQTTEELAGIAPQ
jgi:hypothetical protein